MAWETNNNTKHNESCTMAFGKASTHDNCPRCQELKNGAEPRKWNNNNQYNGNVLTAYCFSVNIAHSRCTKETNPSCACGKMSYTN